MARDIDEFCSCPHPRTSGVSKPRAAHNVARSRSYSRAIKSNQNGQLIMQAIRDLNNCACLEEIIAQLMVRLNCTVLPAGSYKTVAYSLKEAVRFGFLQMQGAGYYSVPTLLTQAEEIEAVDAPTTQRFKPLPLSVLTFLPRLLSSEAVIEGSSGWKDPQYFKPSALSVVNYVPGSSLHMRSSTDAVDEQATQYLKPSALSVLCSAASRTPRTKRK